MTESDRLKVKNFKANQYRREAEVHNIGSPFRINVYINARLAGLSQKAAVEKAKG